jgi:hypothetical protein
VRRLLELDARARYSPFGETASKVVAVPKSTTMSPERHRS